MPRYRCYVRDKEDRAGRPLVVEAEDDAEALIKAAASIQVSLELPIIEVWEGARLVGQVPQRDHIDKLSDHAADEHSTEGLQPAASTTCRANDLQDEKR
jgi:hypothetical protein